MSVFSFQSIFTEFRKSMRLSLPLIASQLMYGLSGFISTAMVAHLGKNALAANVIVWGVFVAMILFFIGILNAVSILVAQSYGAKDEGGIQQATAQGLVLAVVFAVPMILVLWIAPHILYWTGQNKEVIQIAIPYFHSFGWCILPLNILIVLEQFLIGISRTRLVLIMSLLEVPMEIFFFYIFIFGKLGMPQLGLSGVGYGFAMAIVILTILVSLFLHFSPLTQRYKLFSQCWTINKKYLYELIRVGIPLGGMYSIEVALFAAIALMMGTLGNNVLAAHQIAYQCFVFALTVVFGISTGTTVRVGHEVGRNNRDAVKLAAYVNMGIGFIFMLFMAILYIGFPAVVIGIDINIHAAKYKMVVHYAEIFLLIAGILQLTDCFRLIAIGALRGLKDTKVPMYISFIAFWIVAFPIAYLLAFPLHFGGAGIWWGLEIGLAVGAIILVIRFVRLSRRVNLTKLITRTDN